MIWYGYVIMPLLNDPHPRDRSSGFKTIKNHRQLREVLTAEDWANESIFSVIGRMEVLLEYFEDQPKYHPLVPFLQTYYYVTKAIARSRLARRRFFHRVAE